jgi:hypothetical protein
MFAVPNFLEDKEIVNLFINTPIRSTTLLATVSRPVVGTTRFSEKWKQRGSGVKLTTHKYPMPRLICVEIYVHSPSN